jgi:RNA polymerase-interacting CarD/CdnL/TRCF family regulator
VADAEFAHRFKWMVERMKSGDPGDIELVVDLLRVRERDNGLSGGEARLLAKAERLLSDPNG